MTAEAVLRAYATMVPERQAVVRRLAAGDLAWLGQALDRTAAAQFPPRSRSWNAGQHLRPVSPFELADESLRLFPNRPQLWAVDVVDGGGEPRADGKRVLRDLSAAARLGGPDRALQLAWVLLAGRQQRGDGVEQVLSPLVTAQVSLSRVPLLTRGLGVGGPRDDTLGEWELAQLSDWTPGAAVTDATAAASLLEHVVHWTVPPARADLRPVTRSAHRRELREWIVELARLQGIEVARVSTEHPALHEAAEGVTACLGWALLDPTPPTRPNAAATLAAWADVDGIDETAFAAVVAPVGDGDGAPSDPATTEVDSYLPLNLAQRRIVAASRSQPVTVVSGAPGSGKSHLVAAIAADAAGRGGSVLVATRSIAAAEVLAGLLRKQHGPVPIRFGSPAARTDAFRQIERRLAEHEPSGAHLLLDEARQRRDELRGRVAEALADLGAADRWERLRPLAHRHRELAPGLFDPRCDLDRVAEAAAVLRRSPDGWSSWRARRRLRRLGSVGARAVDDAGLLGAADAAVTADRANRAELAPDELAALWPALATAEADLRHWAGRAMDASITERAASGRGRRALGALHAALRAGPASRQGLISAIPSEDLAHGAPLWLGTLAEIEDLLPRVPAMFDLVVLDEASQIDQLTAASALLRARRAVVVGDPRQLRHVSFLADDAQAAAFEAAGLDDVARLDVRRNSVLDLAATVSPVRWLPEHHRSVPHLIGFSLDRFYDGVVTLATRHPRNEAVDAIDVVPTGADPVATVLALLVDLHGRQQRSVGVVTPFRELADAITEAVRADDRLAEFIDDLDLQIGTVHEFQGSERDVVVVVPGLAPDDGARRRAFVNDPHLFNVMVTRARHRIVVVTDLPATGEDLLGQYLRWAAHGPRPVEGGEPVSDLAGELGRALADAGVAVRDRYPSGGWIVDLCAGSGTSAAGLLVGLHPDGVDAHIERHSALTSHGWELVDPAVVRADEIATRAVDLARRLRDGTAQH